MRENIKDSIDDKSPMSVNNITVLASAIMGAIIGFVIGSTAALFFNYEIYAYYYAWAPSKYVY